MTPKPEATPSQLVCQWCGDSVETERVVRSRRFVRLQPHEDIYPTRACEGSGRVFDTWYRWFLSRVTLVPADTITKCDLQRLTEGGSHD